MTHEEVSLGRRAVRACGSTPGHRAEGAGNTSRAMLSIQFSGPLGPLFARLTRKLNERYLALEAKGLRERSEGITASTIEPRSSNGNR
jgi:hypothetical protein